MTNDFWAPVYAKLLENIGFLHEVCFDTSDAVLLSWLRPNRALWHKCAPFVRNGKILNKEGLLNLIKDFASKDTALRRLILFTWIESNSKTMSFPTLALTNETLKELENGKYGSLNKVKILAQIDPREGTKELYQAVIERMSINLALEASVTEDNEKSDYKDKYEALKLSFEELKLDNKSLREKHESAKHEVSVLNQKYEAQSKQMDSLKTEFVLQQQQNKNTQLALELAQKELQKLPLQTEAKADTGQQIEISELKQQISRLHDALSNRDKTIKRISSELENIKMLVRGSEDLELKNKNLKRKLHETEQSIAVTHVLGQLVGMVDDSSWLFLSIQGRQYTLDADLVNESGLIADEFALLSFDSNNSINKLFSLEQSQKKEILGHIKLLNEQNIFESTSSNYPVWVEVSEKQLNMPIRAYYLPEAYNRPEGIYGLKTLSLKSNKHISTPPEKDKGKKDKVSAQRVQEKIFDGQSIVIFGGDQIGNEYETYFSQLNLQVSWHSGFNSIKPIRKGLGKKELIVVILKQISHTLLREILILSRQENIPILYSKRRGTSGVKEELLKYFALDPKNNKAKTY